jgi:hypothetical protein
MFLVVAVLAVGACGVALGAPRSVSHRTLYVTFHMTFHGTRFGLYVTGRTNLPNGTMLMFTLASRAYVNLPPSAPASDAFSHEARLFVHNGQFHTHRLHYYGGRPFPHHGKFQASVIIPAPGVQPANVEAVMGFRAQYLRGPLVKCWLCKGRRANWIYAVRPLPIWTTVQ